MLPEKHGCDNTWAACGAALNEDAALHDLIAVYDYIFLLDSHVRGPFIPPSLKVSGIISSA
jgi:hypothetical protein